MMTSKIKPSSIYIAYICPFCSLVSECEIDIFKFSGDNTVELCCTDKLCGEYCVDITKVGSKFKVCVECPACGETHSFRVSCSSLISKNLFTFSCPESGITIFFSGNKDKIHTALAENAKYISEMEEQFDYVTEELNLFYKIYDYAHKLIENKQVSCQCGSHEIYADIIDDEICLVCQDCNSYIPLKADQATLNYLMNCKHITI